MRHTLTRLWQKLASRPGLRWLNELLFDCSIRGLGILNFESEFLSGETHFLEKSLGPYLTGSAPVVIDAGAHVGRFSRALLLHHPQCVIHAFEPNPISFAKLVDAIPGEQHRLLNRGLSSREGSGTLYDKQDDPGSSHSSVYPAVIPTFHHEAAQARDIEFTTLDAYVGETGLGHVSLLKIDAEGHELEILKGARHLIENGQLGLVHLEFNEMHQISRVFLQDIREQLKDFVPFRLLPRGVIPLDTSPLRSELFAYQNLMFVHRHYAPDSRLRPTR